MDKICYTYLIGWSTHDKWYYGVRYRKGCSPNDLWTQYFTSSKYVKNFRKIHGEPDVIQVRKTFDSSKKAREWERTVLMRMKTKMSEKWLNASDYTSNCSRENQIAVKTKYGKTVNITLDEFEKNRKDYIHFSDGKFSAKDKDGNKFFIDVSDPRYINGELSGVSKGTFPVINTLTGMKYRTTKDDPDYINGVVVHINKGKPMKNATTDHMNIQVQCQVCGKFTNKGNLVRWHKHSD